MMSRPPRQIVQGLVLIAAAFFTAGCEDRNSTADLYYPVDSLITAQIGLLTNAGASVRKVATMGKEANTIVFTPDSIAWVKEMEIFRSLAGINKPINQGVYETHAEQDKKSNLNVLSFVALQEDLPVEYLKVYYSESPQNLRVVEGSVKESNSMYKGKRLLTLEFQDIKGKVFLSGYSVIGGQKMVLADSVIYSIKAGVSLKK